MKNKVYIISLILLFSNILFSEIKIVPIIKSSLLLGQYFFENENGSLGGNINFFISPTINFSENIAILPMISLDYSTTKDVRELVGGGTLTQENLSLGPFNIKFVYKISSDLKFKLKTGYKIEYIKETKDEKWQKGLFDYNKFISGAEVEKVFTKKISFRGSFDYYIIKYPNYQTLVSQNEYQVSLDTTTYSEISKNAGKNVLDYDTIDILLESSLFFTQNIISKIFYNFSLKNFSDQHIVQNNGSFSNELRKDLSNILGLNINFDFERIKIFFVNYIKIYSSNQNSYDVSFVKFIPRSYDYFENTFSPSSSFYFGRNPYMILNLYFDISYRLYLERLAQDISGNYTLDKIWQTEDVFGFNFCYPLENFVKGLSAKLSWNHNFVSSNMKYEKFYKYNYTAYNYFLGFEYRF